VWHPPQLLLFFFFSWFFFSLAYMPTYLRNRRVGLPGDAMNICIPHNWGYPSLFIICTAIRQQILIVQVEPTMSVEPEWSHLESDMRNK
jgi:hypothetical protein